MRGSEKFASEALVGRSRLRLYSRPAGNAPPYPNEERELLGERGAIAQLGERFNGIEEVVGSIPSGSTILINKLDRKCQENLVVSRAKSPPRRHRLRKRPSLSEAPAREPIAAIRPLFARAKSREGIQPT